jgi:D-serine deaminase-like pyridoxal phosphate-dependent protein
MTSTLVRPARAAVPLDPSVPLPVPLDDPRLATPALLIDLDVLDSNVARMAALAGRAGVALRPHAKSHKSLAIAGRQLAAGAVGLCVATVGEAETFFAGGIVDLTLAYPIHGDAKLRRLRPLVAAGALTMVTDSIEIAEGYSRLAVDAGEDIPVLLEIDTGMHRVGIPPGRAGTLGSQVAALPGLEVVGLLTHAGHAHDVLTQPEIAAIARDEARLLADARDHAERAGLQITVVSAGSSLTAPYLTAADGITEIRPGTYVLNDLRTITCYACTADQIAASMLTTMVSVGPGRAVFDAGNKTLTPTRIEQHGYGYPREIPDARVGRLSEEHGVLQLPDTEQLVVGDRVRMLPVHICAWMDLQREVYGVRGGEIVSRITVDAMRRSI